MARTINYRFDFEDGKSWTYDLAFDDAQRLVPNFSRKQSNWAALEFHQCPNCPLNKDKTPQCPIAANVDRIVEDSKSTISYARAVVTVTTPERSYMRKCAAQEGLRSIFALIMASSGCPHLDWFRPLARFHLPFAGLEENLFRVLSLQLLTEFFSKRRHDAKTSALSIQEKYDALSIVNRSFLARIRARCSGDADQNAAAALNLWIDIFELHQENDFSVLMPYF